MGTANPAEGSRDRTGLTVTAIALAASLGAAGMLLLAGLRATEELRGTKAALATSVPAGTLAGWNAETGSKWAPLPGMDSKIVLFSSGPSGNGVDVSFWSEVAAKVNDLFPAVQFVALCASGADCRALGGGTTNLTLLRAMDPMQMRAVAMHGERGEAIIYSGSGTRASLVIGASSDALAAQIVLMLQRMGEAGGA